MTLSAKVPPRGSPAPLPSKGVVALRPPNLGAAIAFKARSCATPSARAAISRRDDIFRTFHLLQRANDA